MMNNSNLSNSIDNLFSTVLIEEKKEGEKEMGNSSYRTITYIKNIDKKIQSLRLEIKKLRMWEPKTEDEDIIRHRAILAFKERINWFKDIHKRQTKFK